MGRHILKQPLHITLKQYRIVAITSVMFIGYMMLIAWEFYEINHATMSAAGVGGFFTYVAALLGAFVKSVNSIQGKHEE